MKDEDSLRHSKNPLVRISYWLLTIVVGFIVLMIVLWVLIVGIGCNFYHTENPANFCYGFNH